ncbi:hypothetical protein N7537_001532 [Penicillium hordei]|uniref:Uncharacterized protein n=1 Tax=Penicillium hordei TaxID=40994 RepID=A0AAD6EFY9_9EURO|nr:uncharacterized protein N7537_001532 [Penicillium hordei]KAJ5616418.1 hypothetical protein N7537_001532 [Penicillium hordei]
MRLTRLDQITLRTGVARATNCATAPTWCHIAAYIFTSGASTQKSSKKKMLRLTRLDQITLRTGVAIKMLELNRFERLNQMNLPRATNCATAPIR